MVHLEYPIMNFRWLWERQLNILIKCFEVILQNHAIYVYPRIEAKIEQENTFIRVGKQRFKKSPKVHLIDAPIVEISYFY
jgi:nicotinate-nucleotide adenylyltransferase